MVKGKWREAAGILTQVRADPNARAKALLRECVERGTRIAFSRDEGSGKFALFSAAVDGSDERRLTDPVAEDTCPAWSPDGRRIVFQSNREGRFQLYLVDESGTKPTRLLESKGNDAGPRWSPDGERILFQSDRDGNEELYMVDAKGANVRRITDHPSSDGCPDWSAVELILLFQSDRNGSLDLYWMTLTSKEPLRLTDHPAIDCMPRWSPDGDRVAFISDRDHDLSSGDFGVDLYVMSHLGKDVVRLTRGVGFKGVPSWSPDGQSLAFESQALEGGGRGIHILDVEGSGSRTLTRPDRTEFAPDWSPFLESP